MIREESVVNLVNIDYKLAESILEQEGEYIVDRLLKTFNLTQFGSVNEFRDFLYGDSIENFNIENFKTGNIKFNPSRNIKRVNVECVEMPYVDLKGNTEITSINMVETLTDTLKLPQKVKYINIDGSRLRHLTGIHNCSDLETLSCVWGKLETIQLSSKKLTELKLACNYLRSINLSRLESLTHLDLQRNNLLGELDLSKNTKLKSVNVSFNTGLTSLILPKNFKGEINKKETGL